MYVDYEENNEIIQRKPTQSKRKFKNTTYMFENGFINDRIEILHFNKANKKSGIPKRVTKFSEHLVHDEYRLPGFGDEKLHRRDKDEHIDSEILTP